MGVEPESTGTSLLSRLRVRELVRKGAKTFADDMTNRAIEPKASPAPQPEEVPVPAEVGVDFSSRDWLAVAWRAGKGMLDDNMMMYRFALAYSTFFAIPSLLLAVVGLSTLLAGRDDRHLIQHLVQVTPARSNPAPPGSLVRLEQKPSAGLYADHRGLLFSPLVDDGRDDELHDRSQPRLRTKDTVAGSSRSESLHSATVARIGAAFLLVVLLLILETANREVPRPRGRLPSILTYVLVGRAMADPDPYHRAARRLSPLCSGSGPMFEHGVAGLDGRQRYRRRDPAARLGVFVFYTARFGCCNKTWWPAAVIIMLTWLWSTSPRCSTALSSTPRPTGVANLRRGEPAKREGRGCRLPAETSPTTAHATVERGSGASACRHLALERGRWR